MLDAKRPVARKLPAPDRNVVTTEAPFWTGTAITGEPNYLSVEGNISVPSIYVNGDETGGEDVHEAVWNGLGGDGTGSGLIQGGYQIDVTKSVVNYTTFREYCCGDSHSNGYKGDFNPKPGDQVYSEEWYCDKNGNKNLTGGYGCTYLHDLNSGAVLNCVSPTSNQCWSVPALPLCSVNPNAANCMTLGKAAEWVIELQSGSNSLQGQDWVDTADTVTLTGSAYSSKTGSYSQTVNQDPFLSYLADFTGITSTSHMNVSIGSGDETYFNVSQFEQVGGLSHSGALNQVIAVGLNMQGAKIGDPWVLGSAANSNGDYPIYNLVFGVWDKMPGAGTQLAIGPEGYPWVVNHAGVAFYWNSGGWTPIGGTYCASHIAVGSGGTYGTPWILGCHEGTNGYNIYKLENGAWVQQTGQATAIAIGKSGPWIVQKSGNVYYWNGSSYKEAPGNPCATSIAAAPITPFGDSWGDVWTTGCHEQSTGYNIYQLQGNSWVQIPGSATSISISPDLGVPWVVNSNGIVFE
jgi:hypothetical protein